MSESNDGTFIGGSLKGLSKQIDQLQVHLGHEFNKQHEQFEAQIQHQIQEQVSLLSKGIGDGMDRLEATVKELSNFEEDKGPVLETGTAGNTDEGAINIPSLNSVNENIELNQNEGGNQYQAVQGYEGYLPEISFPEFDVTDVASWVFKCDIYFDLYQIAECHRTPLAVLHFNDTTVTWYRGEKGNKEHLPWDLLKEMLILRSQNWGYVNPVDEFKQLAQTGSVEEYIEKFQEAKAKMLIESPATSEDYFVGCFIFGLKKEIKSMVQMFENSTLKDAFYHAKLFE